MQTRRLLSDVIEDYLSSRTGQMAPATVRMDDMVLRQFLAHTGNIQVGNVSVAHAERFRAARSAKLTANSMNTVRATLRSFFKWTAQMRLTTIDPMVSWRVMKAMPRTKLYIPPEDFPALLNAASHPRDRIYIAMGLYLFLRQGEITSLRIRDLDLTRDEIEVAVHKTRQRDIMPICSELRVELDHWLGTYRSEATGGLLNDYYLVPGKTSSQWIGTQSATCGRTVAALCPTTRYASPWKSVQRALDSMGLPYDTGEGGHTLRRSGARALYDHLVAGGHDYAIRRVQAMLHHSTISMTEKYLGITADVRARNISLCGKPMFPAPATTLVAVEATG